MRVALLLFFSIVLVACRGDAKQKEIDKLADEVLELHDVVMPLTDTLYKLRRDLNKKMESDSSLNEETVLVIQKLEAGEDAMMDWMHNFNLQYQGETQDDTYSYFVEKKKSILEVTKTMETAQKHGEDQLAKY